MYRAHLTRIDDDDYLYHINICMVYEQGIWVALFYASISYLRVLTPNHILFFPVILSFKYNKQKVKIKSGISKCCYLFSPAGTYALEGIQLLPIMPKSYRKSEAIAAPNQGKDMAFFI